MSVLGLVGDGWKVWSGAPGGWGCPPADRAGSRFRGPGRPAGRLGQVAGGVPLAVRRRG
ncbi:hypothetical protein ABZ714_28760 [Streptomyces sp. NPDC006798]|uniref:hypothetical protein n=1 Tax=Streptomyces sp. NPDC006798 TaxID=3155462 RepID=UPI0033D0ABCE